MKTAKIAGCLLLTGLGGCGLEPYQLPDGVESARLKVAPNVSRAWVCDASSSIKKLMPDESGYAVIPAGHRVTIGASFVATGYHVTYSCFPKIGLVPVAGASYYQDFETEAERCTSLIFREVTTNPVGLDFEPSEGGAIACPAK